MHDLIIIGGGPAGITAGIYAARQKLNTLLITKDFGGQIARKAVDIENYPGFEKITGQDLIKKFENHLRKFTRQNPALLKKGGTGGREVNITINEVKKIEKNKEDFFVITKNKEKFKAKTVIIASGADPRPLEVPGEKEFIGKGVSYCAVCDGPVFADKIVAVIGGGNAGFESAIFLANYVKKIYILEYGPEIKADEINQEIVKKSGKAEIITDAVLKEIKGKPPTTFQENLSDKRNAQKVVRGKDFVKSIVYQDLKTKETKNLEVQGVFVEIGSQPATSFAKKLVDFNKKDEIKVEFETCQTKTPGLFAVGDANVGRYKQIVTACGEGAKATLAAYEYLQKHKI